jgi:hypothetical protein
MAASEEAVYDVPRMLVPANAAILPVLTIQEKLNGSSMPPQVKFTLHSLQNPRQTYVSKK